MSRPHPVIIWLRRDLRLADNPALHAGVQSGKPLILLYINEVNKGRDLGAASKVWLHHSLTSLSTTIADKGGQLILRRGHAAYILDELIAETGADEIHWNRRYEGWAREIDQSLKTNLKSRGLKVESHKANLLVEPWEVATKTGGFYKVFTPFWRAARANSTVDPDLPAAKRLNCLVGLNSDKLPEWNLLPTSLDWGTKIMTHHKAGEVPAMRRLESFLAGPVGQYDVQRDRPDDERGTSKLSPHLAFGEISPRQIWNAAYGVGGDSDKFLSEIGWREFSYTLLFYNPELASQNYKPDFDKFPWDSDPAKAEAWRLSLIHI